MDGNLNEKSNLFKDGFINYLVDNFIPISIQDGLVLVYGFYKYDYVTLIIENKTVYTTDRYGITTEHGSSEFYEETFKMLVSYNCQVWKNYRSTFKSPNYAWLPYLLKLGFIKETKTISYE